MTRLAIVCLALLTSTGCSRFDVGAVQDPAARFADLATFAWMPSDLALPGDQRLQDRGMERIVRDGVERGMASQGYAAGTANDADILVTYRLVQAGRDAAGAPRGFAFDGTGTWMRSSWSTDSYQQGALVVDLFDAKAKRLVWRGMASARLLPHKSYEWKIERARQAIDAIMDGAPPRR